MYNLASSRLTEESLPLVMGGANLEPYAFVFVHFGQTAVSLQCGRNAVLAKRLDHEMAQKELATEEQRFDLEQRGSPWINGAQILAEHQEGSLSQIQWSCRLNGYLLLWLNP